jgi:uncharacterized protein (TIGR03437 family)
MQRSAVTALLACAVAAHAASYTTYIGDANQYQVSAIATDANGNTYITGGRIVTPASPATYNTPVTDVFVGKLDPSGNLTLIGTFSGKGIDQANGIAVDPSGNIYVVGMTTSTDFPLRNPLQSVAFTMGGMGGGSGFLMKLAPDGSPIYSTYLGGTLGPGSMNSVAADAGGNAYVTGWTAATDYPHTPGLPAGLVSTGPVEYIYAALFAKINPAGSKIVYAGAVSAAPYCEAGFATCRGATVSTAGNSIALDPAGNAYIAGNTDGDLAGTPGTLLASGTGAFVVKVNAAGTGLVYLTLLGTGDGGEATDTVSAIAVDGAGNAYISGSTSDPHFPVTAGAFQTTLANPATPPNVGPSDAFVAKLNPTGSAMVWATFLGGTGFDAAQTIATDSPGNVWVSGTTQSTDFPAKVSVAPGGSEFLAELNSTGSVLTYSAVFPSDTVAQALAVDSSGTVHVAGAAGLISAFPDGSAPGQTSAPWMFGLANAAGLSLSGRLAPGELVSIYGIQLVCVYSVEAACSPPAPVSATFDATGFLPTTLGGVQVTINGTPAPLLYVSATQINAVAPIELTAGSAAELQIIEDGTPLPDFRVMVDIAAPGVFVNSDGSAAAINQDGSVNSKANPAPVGSYVSIWATGTGYFPGSDGQMATGANQFCDPGLLLCAVFQSDGIPGSGGTPVNVTYSGAAPGAVNGVVQINFQVPPPADGYYLSVDGINSNTFDIYTTP